MRNHLSGSRILVTGATGFVGTHLTEELLSQGASVIALINDFSLTSLFREKGLLQGVTPVVGSLTDFPLLQKILKDHKIDTVIHLAAIATEGVAFQNPLSAFEINIRGTYHLLEACREQKAQVKKIIIASSDKAYGTPESLPYQENLPLNGKHPYDVSKSCADLLAQAYHHSFGLPVVIGRYGNIFGAGDPNFNRLIPGTLLRLYKGESPVVKAHPDGPFTRDFLYIKDVVNSYLAMLDGLNDPKIHGHAFNFALSGNWQVTEIVGLLQKITGSQNIVVQKAPASHGEIKDQQVCNKKALRLLNWKPTYTLEEGLHETAQWYFRKFCRDGVESRENQAVLRIIHG